MLIKLAYLSIFVLSVYGQSINNQLSRMVVAMQCSIHTHKATFNLYSCVKVSSIVKWKVLLNSGIFLWGKVGVDAFHAVI